MQKREIVTVVLLSIFTCGIYALYWFYTTSEALNNEVDDNEPLRNFVVAILLGMVTCGIYTLYWLYKFYTKVDKYTGENNAILNFVLGFFGLEIVSIALAQSSINKKLEA
ncbi:MAG: DUF4234 domain-containing protein [Anaeroplasmataceae bacterium]|nr:DUF4234 domain-containing protein [Anaeroplasmataceae bacterium]